MFDPNSIMWDTPSHILLSHGFITLLSPLDTDLRHDTWQLHRDQRGRAYARRQISAFGNRSGLYLHRAIMLRVCSPPSPSHVVDHLNGNGLDNRRENLRWATVSENTRSKSNWTYWRELGWQRAMKREINEYENS
jgi:hypothetical protein